MRRAPLLATLATASALLAGLPAQAGSTPDPNLGDTVLGTVGGIRYAMEAVLFGPSSYGDTAAGCGAQSFRVVGGGATASEPLLAWQAAHQFTDSSADLGAEPDDGYSVGAHGPEGETLTVFSICMRDTPTKVVSVMLPTQPTLKRTGTASCGGSRWHVSDGAVFVATSGSWIATAVPKDGGDADVAPDDGWTGVAYDTLGGIGHVYVHVACIKGRATHHVTGARVALPPGASRVRKAACAAGEHVVGGGMRAPGPVNEVRMVSSAPYDGPDADTIPDDGWRVRATNLSGATKQLTPYAVCVR